MATDTRYRLNCALVNIQSVGNKTHEIRDYINDNKLDILVLTETWLSKNDSAKIREMTPDTHTFLHVPREDRRGGGVGIFISNTLSKIKKEKVSKTDYFELMQASCMYGGKKLLFIIVYRSPSLNEALFRDEFRLYLEGLNQIGSEVFVCGDFNFWVDDTENESAKNFIEMMNILGFENKVDKITTNTGHMLDLIFSESNKDLILGVDVDDICVISPVHMVINFKLNVRINCKQRKKIIFRNKSNLNKEELLQRIIDEISQEASDICEHGFVSKRNCLRCYISLFRSTGGRLYDNECPLIAKEIIVKDNAPWYDCEVLMAKREKRRRERKWRSVKNEASKNEYNVAKNALNSLIRRKKREYYRRKIEELGLDINKLYAIIDNLTGNRKKILLPEGFSDEELADMFSDFFENKIENLIGDFVEEAQFELHPVVSRENRLNRFVTVDLSKIKTIVKRVKKTFCESDPFPISDVSECEHFDGLLRVYLEIVNLSILSIMFPESEKYAILKPALKGSLDPQSLSSYRPISNLSFLSKIIENVILDQMMEFLEETRAFPDNQSAYRKLYSTETALCSVVNDLQIMMDEGKCGILILLDLSAAFDTVVHSLLLKDLKAIGIEGDALDYLETFLVNRTYCVQVGKSFSSTKVLARGVPQGSVLGPILFCIYTIELMHLLRSHGVHFQLFADDTQFYLSLGNIEDSERKINDVMTDVKRWMNSKQLKLNDSKTECLLVGKKHDLRRLNFAKLKVLENEFEVMSPIKNLGVIFDCSLSFSEQINQAVKTAGYHLRNIAFLKKYLDDKTVTMLIHNYVISRLDYCNVLYYGLPNYNLKKIQNVLNRAARLIRGLSPRERITPTLIELHWLPVKARIIFKMCVLTYQALGSGKPLYMRNMLKNFRPDTMVSLRHSDDPYRLEEPRSRTSIGTRAFERSAPRVFNRLPLDVKQSPNCQVFKKRLKTYIFADCYQSGEINNNYRI